MTNENSQSKTPRVGLAIVDTSPPSVSRVSEPVTVGVPLPKGVATSTGSWGLRSADGAPLALQARVLDRWGDESIRWALLDFQATQRPGPASAVTLVLDGGATAPPTSIAISRTDDAITIDTGAATFSVSAQAAGLFSKVLANGAPVIDGTRSALVVITSTGRPAAVRWCPPVVEEEGALRAVVRIVGDATCERDATLRLVARLHFFAASPVVRLLLTIRNPRRAAHTGGSWELGDHGSMLLKDVSIVLRRPVSDAALHIACSVDATSAVVAAREHVEVYQDSSGGDNWNSPNHVNRDRIVPHTFRGYLFRADSSEHRGLRANPIVWLNGGSGPLGATLPYFWQNFARAIRASRDTLEVGLFPGEYADLHELQGGEQKTHECYLLFGRDGTTDVPLAWCRSRLLVSASPEWYAATEAVPYLTPAASDAQKDYLALVNAAIEGPDTFVRKRERIDEYGWRNFGDIYADHEAASHKGSAPFVSHYNNQYDATAGFAIQYMRNGDPRWFAQMDELARHVVDIDIYHTDRDKAAYNHGLFWHTCHYVDAGCSSHRSYPRAKNVWGGGPSAEHDYSTGLMLHYFLTGSGDSREAVLELARWVIDMDDGRKTVFRWLDRGYTGLASATGSTLYHGPGRGAGNSILTLLNAHTLTGEGRYLEKAEQLIRRCIHPDDDIPALNLLDAERRWYYNVFLQVMGRYLHFKAERGQLDAMYGYVRASLLHYARWMAANEYPYLEKPEILEYPNETWAAQDMRKSEVFMHAALHATGGDRRRFEERAAFFFDYSTSKLLSMPTHVLARPTVLMLVNGYMRAWFVAHPDHRMPDSLEKSYRFGAPVSFVPQKVRAKRRAFIAAAALSLAGVGGLAALALLAI